MTKLVHFMGIAGSGASSVAEIAQRSGFEVSGCDLSSTETSVKFSQGHSTDHLEGIDILAISPAIKVSDPTNPELKKALSKGIEILTWQEFMAKYLLKDKFTIAVCGTHGKSTTTAMIATILEKANLDPTVFVGAKINSWKTNFRVGKSDYFVIEADEYNNNFLNYHPEISIVLNIDSDHLDFFKDLENLKASFEQFLSQSKQSIVANLLDENVAETIKWVMKHQKPAQVLDFNKLEVDLNLKIFGEFNLSNAKAAFQTGLILGIQPELIKKSLEEFEGANRRFELLTVLNGAKIYSDFAHHPKEISETLNAAKIRFPDSKLWLIFQPHLYSRTKLLFDQFVQTFHDTKIDKTIILDIFKSRESDPGDISSKMLVEAVKKKSVIFIPTINQAWEMVLPQLSDQDVVIVMGAGDIDQKIRQILKL